MVHNLLIDTFRKGNLFIEIGQPHMSGVRKLQARSAHVSSKEKATKHSVAFSIRFVVAQLAEPRVQKGELFLPRQDKFTRSDSDACATSRRTGNTRRASYP